MEEEPPVFRGEGRRDEDVGQPAGRNPPGPVSRRREALVQAFSVAVGDGRRDPPAEIEEAAGEGRAAGPEEEERGDGENRGRDLPLQGATSTDAEAVRPKTSGSYISSARDGATPK